MPDKPTYFMDLEPRETFRFVSEAEGISHVKLNSREYVTENGLGTAVKPMGQLADPVVQIGELDEADFAQVKAAWPLPGDP